MAQSKALSHLNNTLNLGKACLLHAILQCFTTLNVFFALDMGAALTILYHILGASLVKLGNAVSQCLTHIVLLIQSLLSGYHKAPPCDCDGDASGPLHLQFGTITLDILNEIQLAARTSPAPAKRDEQKHEETRHDSVKTKAALPTPTVPQQKAQIKRTDAEAHPVYSGQISGAPTVTQIQNHCFIAIPGTPMQMQPPMPLPLPSQVQQQQQVLVPLHEGQTLNMQYQPCVPSRRIKITHPITREEVKLDSHPRPRQHSAPASVSAEVPSSDSTSAPSTNIMVLLREAFDRYRLSKEAADKKVEEDSVGCVTVEGRVADTEFVMSDKDELEISTPKMETLIRDEGANRVPAKKYSRDFLLKFEDHSTDPPEDFRIIPEIKEIVFSKFSDYREPHPNPGRIIGRPMGGSRRGSGMGNDEKWTKQPGPPASGNGGNGSRLGQGGILSGSMQRTTSFQKGLVSSPRTPLQVIHRAEKKYEVGKVTNEEQAKQRQLKGILNKLTPQNFEKLFEQVKQIRIDNVGTLTGVISQIFDKALMEPTFCEMYADFCYCLAGELPDFNVNNEKITFKRLLLTKCQEEFERGEREEEEANRVDEAKQSEEERDGKITQARRRMLGNIRLVGELYKKKMLTERIMHECIRALLGQNPDEENIESLCKLMNVIGAFIDHPTAKEHMDEYFDVMARLSENMNLSSRVRFMLKDSIDLRKNGWQQRRKVEGPKKIEEVHRDAAQEQKAQSSSLACGPSIISSVRRGPHREFAPRGSNVSLRTHIGGYCGMPQPLRGYGKDIQSVIGHSYENSALSWQQRRKV